MRKLLGALALVGMTAVPAFASPKVLCRNGEIVRNGTCHGRGGVAAVQPPRRHWYQMRAPQARCRDGSIDRGRNRVCMYHGGVARFL